MGLLDQLLSATTGGTTTAAPAPAPQTTLQTVVNLLHSPQIGGVAGLLRLFQQNGLGDIAGGWVGTGPNPGVSTSQLAQVLGPDRLAQFARQLGVPQEQATQHLAQVLPHVVDRMTSDGQVPQQPTTSSAVFDMLKSHFLGG